MRACDLAAETARFAGASSFAASALFRVNKLILLLARNGGAVNAVHCVLAVQTQAPVVAALIKIGQNAVDTLDVKLTLGDAVLYRVQPASEEPVEIEYAL